VVVRHDDGASRLWVASLETAKRLDVGTTPKVGTLTWLDEERIVFDVPTGPPDMSYTTLVLFDWKTRTQTFAAPPAKTCTDTLASSSPRGDRLVFWRLCEDSKDDFVGLIRTR
jgi:hypothetical protein